MNRKKTVVDEMLGEWSFVVPVVYKTNLTRRPISISDSLVVSNNSKRGVPKGYECYQIGVGAVHLEPHIMCY